MEFGFLHPTEHFSFIKLFYIVSRIIVKADIKICKIFSMIKNCKTVLLLYQIKVVAREILVVRAVMWWKSRGKSKFLQSAFYD